MRRLTLALALGAAAAVAAPLAPLAPLAAQAAQIIPTLDGKEPKRPELPAGADTNDAKAYYDWGMGSRVSWQKALPAFYWAYRLQPDDESYRFAYYQAVANSRPIEWWWEYMDGAEYVMKSKEAKLLDTLLTLTMTKQPFVHLYSRECRIDPYVLQVKEPDVAGRWYWEAGCYNKAAQKYGEALAKKPNTLWMRIDRAKALYWTSEYGNSLAELDAALAMLRARDAKRTSRLYQSKEMLEYMRGDVFERQDDFNKAKQAYAKALEENVAFYMAHARLARVALLQGEVDEALQEYDQALQINAADPTVRHEYAVALMAARKFEDAERELRKTIELEPYWSLPHMNLALTLEGLNRPADAVTEYRSFLAVAPRRAAKLVGQANARVAQLGAGGAK